MYKIFHLICNRPAMLYEERPVNGQRIEQDKCRRLDGTVYGDGEVPYCGSCGKRLYGLHLIPDPNDYKVYDMTSDEDMAIIYGPAPGVPGPRIH